MKIAIEGNIGCGKSSILTRLVKELRVPVFLEPVDEWSQWLTAFYTNPSRWGMQFNTHVLLTFNRWKNNDFFSIYERSPVSNRHIFAQLQYEAGHMNDLELAMFQTLYDKLGWAPDVILYLRTDPTVAYSRMNTRGRTCESSVSLDYLEKVHQKYEAIGNHHRNVHVVDANRSHDEVYADIAALIVHYSKQDDSSK